MSAHQKRQLYCVWNNLTDEVIAIDETADKCAKLMGITRNRFYGIVGGRITSVWVVIKSQDLESEVITA